jgi:hypothetical protein
MEWQGETGGAKGGYHMLIFICMGPDRWFAEAHPVPCDSPGKGRRAVTVEMLRAVTFRVGPGVSSSQRRVEATWSS